MTPDEPIRVDESPRYAVHVHAVGGSVQRVDATPRRCMLGRAVLERCPHAFLPDADRNPAWQWMLPAHLPLASVLAALPGE
jgi:hypothetical protein